MLKRYDVVINGVKTTLQLSEKDAAALGLFDECPQAPAAKAKTPANKARKTPNKKA